MQNVGIIGDTRKSSTGIGTKGLCVSCSPDGFIVMMGCSDAAVRTFTQDTEGFRRAVQVSASFFSPRRAALVVMLELFLCCAAAVVCAPLPPDDSEKHHMPLLR